MPCRDASDAKGNWTIVKKVDKGTEKIKSNSRNGQVIKGY